MLSGVPQGSVLGPLLFLIYVNDATLESLHINSKVILYADDILLHRIITCPSGFTALQADINTLSKWVSVKNLTLNAAKCKYMIISRLSRNSIPAPPITLNGQPLEKVSSYRYLGVTISKMIYHGILVVFTNLEPSPHQAYQSARTNSEICSQEVLQVLGQSVTQTSCTSQTFLVMQNAENSSTSLIFLNLLIV